VPSVSHDGEEGAPILETPRLWLRRPRIEDFERYAEAMADEVVARYIGGVQPRAAAWRRFLQMPGAWALQGFAMFSLIDKASGRWLGQCGPWRPEGWPGNEIGWSLHRDAWGQGYATEAAEASLAYAFDVLGWTEAVHCIDPANAASQHVAARVGSRKLRTAVLPPPYDDTVVDVWGQSRDEWRARRAAVAGAGNDAGNVPADRAR